MHAVGKLLLGLILAPLFACLRYYLGEYNAKTPSLPAATLGVNLAAAVCATVVDALCRARAIGARHLDGRSATIYEKTFHDLGD